MATDASRSGRFMRTRSIPAAGGLLLALVLAGCFGGSAWHEAGPETRNGIIGAGEWHSAGGETCTWSANPDNNKAPLAPPAFSLIRSGPRYAVISPWTLNFYTNNCGPWVQAGGPFDVLYPINIYGIVAGNGDFLVGPEIPPGTYEALSPGPHCQWARVNNFTGWWAGIDYPGYTNPEIETGTGYKVVIAPTDHGFRTVDCGFWHKIA